MGKEKLYVPRHTEPGSPFGARLRQLRLAANMSQEALAERVGSSRLVVGRLEWGKNPNPSLATLRKVAAALGTTVGGLVDGLPDG